MKTNYRGELVNLKLLPHGLELRLTRAGRAYLKGELSNPRRDSKFHTWAKSHAYLLADLLEDFRCNGYLELASGDHYAQLSALTDSPIILWDAEFDDQMKITDPGRVFWFPEYAVTSELDSLYDHWRVTFTEAD